MYTSRASPLRLYDQFYAITSATEPKKWYSKQSIQIKKIFEEVKRKLSPANLSQYNAAQLDAIPEDIQNFKNLVYGEDGAVAARNLDPKSQTLLEEYKPFIDEIPKRITKAKAEIALNKAPEKRTANDLILILTWNTAARIDQHTRLINKQATKQNLPAPSGNTYQEMQTHLDELVASVAQQLHEDSLRPDAFTRPNVLARWRAFEQLDISSKDLVRIPDHLCPPNLLLLKRAHQQLLLEANALLTLDKEPHLRTVPELVHTLMVADPATLQQRRIDLEIEAKIKQSVSELEQLFRQPFNKVSLEQKREAFRKLQLPIDQLLQIPNDRSPLSLKRLQAMGLILRREIALAKEPHERTPKDLVTILISVKPKELGEQYGLIQRELQHQLEPLLVQARFELATPPQTSKDLEQGMQLLARLPFPSQYLTHLPEEALPELLIPLKNYSTALDNLTSKIVAAKAALTKPPHEQTTTDLFLILTLLDDRYLSEEASNALYRQLILHTKQAMQELGELSLHLSNPDLSRKDLEHLLAQCKTKAGEIEKNSHLLQERFAPYKKLLTLYGKRIKQCEALLASTPGKPMKVKVDRTLAQTPEKETINTLTQILMPPYDRLLQENVQRKVREALISKLDTWMERLEESMVQVQTQYTEDQDGIDRRPLSTQYREIASEVVLEALEKLPGDDIASYVEKVRDFNYLVHTLTQEREKTAQTNQLQLAILADIVSHPESVVLTPEDLATMTPLWPALSLEKMLTCIHTGRQLAHPGAMGEQLQAGEQLLTALDKPFMKKLNERLMQSVNELKAAMEESKKISTEIVQQYVDGLQAFKSKIEEKVPRSYHESVQKTFQPFLELAEGMTDSKRRRNE